MCVCVCVCVCLVCTDLAAWVHVKQTHSTRQLFGILNAVPQYTGGEVQWALIRLKKNTHTHTSWMQLLKSNWDSIASFTQIPGCQSDFSSQRPLTLTAVDWPFRSIHHLQNLSKTAGFRQREPVDALNTFIFYYASERLWFYSSVPRLHSPKPILSDRTTLILSAGTDILPWVHCMTKLCSALSNLFCTTALSTNNTHFSVSLLVSIKMHIYNFFLWDILYKLPDIKIPQRWSY